MRNPDTGFWRAWNNIIRWMSARAPQAPTGETWCLYCVRNDGRTLVLPPDDGPRHAQEDHEEGDKIYLQFGDETREQS